MNDDTSKEVASQEHSPATSWVRDAAWDARRFGRGIWAAIFCGFLIGGVGGRLAMFVLRLTSDPSLKGRLTDDGFEIGSFTGNTFFLVALCTAAGLLGGLFFLVVRGWLPERGRPLMMAAFGGAVGGSVVIHPGGIDFTQLDPLALAIVMFIALPALYGAAMSRLVDLWIARANQAQRPEHAGALGAVVAFAPLTGAGHHRSHRSGNGCVAACRMVHEPPRGPYRTPLALACRNPDRESSHGRCRRARCLRPRSGHHSHPLAHSTRLFGWANALRTG